MRDPRYDVLFEPVKIGPVTAPNRFYQVPHCSGMGYRRPEMLAAMRGVKAEGGWGVVCTEYCSIHPSSDDDGYPYARLWSDEDLAAQALMVEAVHKQGALAGVELWHGGSRAANLTTREPGFGVRSGPAPHMPVQSRPMDKSDLADLRSWQGAAARRARRAGFDIVYVYAAHGYLLSEFLSSRSNTRCDEYGGSLENRARLVRELLEETREAVGDACAVACRFSLAAESGGAILEPAESRDLLALLAELPDLWDLTVDDYSIEMGSARFVEEAAQEETIAAAKTLTTKPVVGVGRFTSPDTMLRQVTRGVLDLIGAARPSIADPFLPKKIEEGRLEDIRECIGCNICYAHNSLGAPIRCTQNPTMGEEWRRGWHPETIPAKASRDSVLVIGGGPAGLEAARALGQRGCQVTLAEAGTELGGRVTQESRLPGLAAWARVRDWRLGQIRQMANVATYLDSRLSAEDVLGFEASHVLVATGARWHGDGTGRWLKRPFAGAEMSLAPDALLARWPDVSLPDGPVLLYDDDRYYLGSALALGLRQAGYPVVLVTPEGRVGQWSQYTEELHFANARLLEASVEIVTNHFLESFDGAEARLACVFTGRETVRPAASVVPVTARTPDDGLFRALAADPGALQAAGMESLRRIGDCDAPGIIAAAIYSGHRAARAVGAPDEDRPRQESTAPVTASGCSRSGSNGIAAGDPSTR